jgi:hypothetical protein
MVLNNKLSMVSKIIHTYFVETVYIALAIIHGYCDHHLVETMCISIAITDQTVLDAWMSHLSIN